MKARLFPLFGVLLVIVGCGKGNTPVDSEALAAVPRRLPGQTLLYARLTGVSTLKDRVAQPGHLLQAAAVQDKINKLYASLLKDAGDQGLVGLKEESLKKLVNELQA